MQPQVMLFDEATSALDPELVGEVQGVMRALADDGMTMIIVTHEIAFAREVADEVVFMRDGIVEESGPAKEVIDNPQQAATRLFFSRFNGKSPRSGDLPLTNQA
jgi:polar amino acid transport system ATP-binding protein